MNPLRLTPLDASPFCFRKKERPILQSRGSLASGFLVNNIAVYWHMCLTNGIDAVTIVVTIVAELRCWRMDRHRLGNTHGQEKRF